jgi:hypothetical protein
VVCFGCGIRTSTSVVKIDNNKSFRASTATSPYDGYKSFNGNKTKTFKSSTQASQTATSPSHRYRERSIFAPVEAIDRSKKDHCRYFSQFGFAFVLTPEFPFSQSHCRVLIGATTCTFLCTCKFACTFPQYGDGNQNPTLISLSFWIWFRN